MTLTRSRLRLASEKPSLRKITVVRFLTLGLVAAGTVAIAPSASANTATCADSAHVVETLNERFGETHLGDVRSDTNEILAIYSNASSNTWTILLTLPERGLSCLVASGTGEQPLATQLARLEG